MHMMTSGTESIGEAFLLLTEMYGNTQTIPCSGPNSSFGCKCHTISHAGTTKLTFSAIMSLSAMMWSSTSIDFSRK